MSVLALDGCPSQARDSSEAISPPAGGRLVLLGRDIRHSFGATAALAGVDLQARAGEIHAVLGPNGAGKTTLLSILAGLLRPDGGAVQVSGVDALRRPRAAARHIGFAQQVVGLYPVLTARQNLEFFAGLNGLSPGAARRRAVAAAEDLGVGPLLDRHVDQLSGGQRRIVHCAVAMVHEPALLLLDEPTAGVDWRTRDSLLAALERLAGRGVTIFYATHHLNEVERLKANVLVLDRGRVAAQGSVADLVRQYADSVVEMIFDGPAPSLDLGAGVRLEHLGSTVRIACADPVAVSARALAGLGRDATRLRGVEIKRPSLEAVVSQVAPMETPRRADLELQP